MNSIKAQKENVNRIRAKNGLHELLYKEMVKSGNIRLASEVCSLVCVRPVKRSDCIVQYSWNNFNSSLYLKL